MSDFLLELASNPNARRMVKQLGLPVPMPQPLRRARGPWQERPLADRAVAVGGVTAKSAINGVLAHTLASAGANPVVVCDAGDALLADWVEAGEAFGRPPVAIEPGPAPDDAKVHALVFDGTTITSPEELRGLYDFFHAWIRRVGKCGRVVVIGRPPEDAPNPVEASARAALSGFGRSLAKEVGKKGATSQFVYVAEGAEARLEAVIRWILSERSAFVDGQPFVVNGATEWADNQARWTRPLEGKTALVTGAARSIGAAAAKTLAEAGARVTVLDLPSDDGPASKTARAIGGDLLLMDVTSEHAANRIAEHFEPLGGLDVLVHNAGITRDKTIAKMKPEYWDLCVNVNLTAVARITEALLKSGTLNDGGRLIGLSSIAGIAGNMGQTNYAASKAGVIGWVHAMAADPDVIKRGITVNAIAPGFIESRLTDRIPTVIREVGRRFNTLSQGGLPVDVAEAITFLATPGAQGLTGNVIRVCGQNMLGA